MCNIGIFGAKDMLNLFDVYLFALKCVFALRNYGYSFHHVFGNMGNIFQTFAESWVQIFNQNGTSPSKIWFTLPTEYLFYKPC